MDWAIGDRVIFTRKNHSLYGYKAKIVSFSGDGLDLQFEGSCANFKLREVPTKFVERAIFAEAVPQGDPKTGEVRYVWSCEVAGPLCTGESHSCGGKIRVPDNPTRAPDLIYSAAKTFAGRNSTYGDTYNTIGEVLLAFFPDGVTLNNADEFRRFSTLLQSINKLHRYAACFSAGGHLDSAHDLIVYAAMLEEQTTKESTK